MKANQIIFIIVLGLLALVKSQDENKRLEFLIEAPACKNVGGKCSDSEPCCDNLTCSEFKFCRN